MRARGAARARMAMAVALALVLSACGGGGDGGTSQPAPVQATAIPDNLAITAPTITEMAGATAFTNSAASLGGLTYAWSFGDGTTSAEASPKHDYAKAGDFEVSLKVSNAAGATKEVKYKLAVNNRALVKGLSCSGDGQAGWCWQAPLPSGNTVNDTFFVSSQVGWTVGDSGEIHKSIDGGKTWTRQVSGITGQLSAVRFADASNGWAVGAYGAVLRTTDGGAHWTLQSASLPDGYSTGLTVVNASTAVITSAGGGLLSGTTDGGATWTPISLNGYAVTVASDGILWSTSYDGLRKSSDLGKTWTLVRPLSNVSYVPSLAVNGLVVKLVAQTYSYDPVQGSTYTTAIHASGDGGATWETITPQGLTTNFVNYLVDFVDASTGALSAYSDLYLTTDGGRTWAKADAPTGASTGSVDNRLLLPGVRYRGYYDASYKYIQQVSEDAGRTWRTATAPSRYGSGYGWSAQRLQRVDSQTWTAIADGSVWVSVDGMKTWAVVRGLSSTQTPRNFNALWFFDASRGLALTQYGELLETKNGGLDWAVKLSNLPAGYGTGARIQFIGATKGWLLTGDGKIYTTTDGGERWSAPLTSLTASFRNMHFIDANNGFATGIENTSSYQRKLFATSDGGQSWAAVSTLNEDFNGIHFSSLQQGVLVGAGGRIMSTADGGKTWVGRYSGTNAQLTSVAAGDSGLWAVGQTGAMINSKDGGVTWAPLLPLTTASLQKVRFLDALQGWAVGSSGTILATQDGGRTWKLADSGTRISLNDVYFVDSRTGWIAGEAGTLLVTGTGGQ